MKKRVLATILTVCLLFAAMTCIASAANVEVADIPATLRVCPGKVINADVITEPEITGYAKASGWEVQTEDGMWIPYTSEVIGERQADFQLRYFAVDYSDEYVYSNECTVRVAHMPIGDYQYSGTDHWRICDDCGGQAEKGGHTHLQGDATSADKVCRVCGHVRTSQWTGLLGFWEWIMQLIASLLG